VPPLEENINLTSSEEGIKKPTKLSYGQKFQKGWLINGLNCQSWSYWILQLLISRD